MLPSKIRIVRKVKIVCPEYYPLRGTPYSAGIDLRAVLDGDEILVMPRKPVIIRTGVIMEIPEGHYGLLDIRSSYGIKGLDLACRIIDSDYRGEIKMVVKNDGEEPVAIRRLERIGQIVLMPYLDATLEFVNERDLSPSGRGTGGFGSTGG
jgi:dUTP pyrophosphatase